MIKKETTITSADGVQSTTTTNNSVKSRFIKYDNQRKAVLDRARKCSELTIPALLPPEGHNESQPLPTPYQGLGARGVNNLASKLLLTLLPPNSPFFRLSVDDATLMELNQQDKRAQVEAKLNQIERDVMTEIETTALRVPSFEALKLLIVTGNALEFLPDEGGMRVYRLDQYVVKRDPMGNVLEIIIKERVHPVVLPDNIRTKAQANIKNPDEKVDLYTQIIRDKKLWRVRQEVADEVIPQSIGTYPLDKSPWLPLRWTAVNGEDYGRGLVEEYIGDLISLEGITEAIVKFAAAASKVVFLVNSNGTTRAKDLADAESGDFKKGNAADVTVLQMQKYADFQVAQQVLSKIEQRLAQAFLLMSSIQRDAERVTAEEIREMAKELEDSLGGVYSVLSLEMQLPLVKRLMSQMEKQGKLPALPDKIIQPMITVGLEALGRGNDLTKLNMFIQGLQILGPEVIQTYLNVGDYITRVGTALGIDMGGLVKTDEEVAAAQNQAMMQQLVSTSAPDIAKEVTKGAVNSAQNQNPTGTGATG